MICFNTETRRHRGSEVFECAFGACNASFSLCVSESLCLCVNNLK